MMTFHLVLALIFALTAVLMGSLAAVFRRQAGPLDPDRTSKDDYTAKDAATYAKNLLLQSVALLMCLVGVGGAVYCISVAFVMTASA